MNPFAQGTIPYKWFESKTSSEKDQILADVNKYGIKSFSIGLQYNPDYGKFQFDQYMTSVADPSNPYAFGSDTYKFYQSLTPEGKSALNANSYAKIALPAIINFEGGVEKALKKASSIVNSRPGGPNPGTYEYVNMVNPFLKTGSLLDAVGDAIGDVGDIVKDLGPIAVVVGNAIVPGLGTALGVAAAIDEGADPVDIAKNIAVGELVNQLDVGSNITDSSVAADLVDNTLKGLLTGQDLDKALTNSVISSVAGEVTNQTKDDFQADVENVLDSAASTPVSDYLSDVNDVLDMPVTPEPVSGQDLAADAVPGNTIDDIINVLPPLTEPQLPPAPEPPAPEPPATEPGLTKAQVETLIKTALAATAADQVINQPETKPPGFDIVPVPTEWKSPTYDQTFTPVDLDSIFKNLQDTQYQWKPRPDITGGAYMGSPVNISDIVNNIMSAELTPTTMPSQITNAVGGILGPTATR